MELFAALLAPFLFGATWFTTLLDSDDEEEVRQQPDPDPETVTLKAGDADYTGTAEDNVVTAGNGFYGTVDGGAGDDTLTGHGAETAEAYPNVRADYTPAWTYKGEMLSPPDRIPDVIALRGGEGDDLLTATGVADVDGGAGADRLDLSGMSEGIVKVGIGDTVVAPTGDKTNIGWLVESRASLDLSDAGSAQTVTWSGPGADVTGSAHDDKLITAGDDVTLRGGDGDDYLKGNFRDNSTLAPGEFSYEGNLGSGNDLLIGGDGNDRIIGDLGDTMTGGAGEDNFTAWLSSGSTAHVTDFDPAQDSLTILVDGEKTAAGDVTKVEADGNTILRLNGEDLLVIEGRTGLSFGVNLAETGVQIGNDSGYLGLDGKPVNPDQMDVLIQRYTNAR